MANVIAPADAEGGGLQATPEAAQPEVSPLAEASVDSLDELFDRFDQGDIGYRNRDIDAITTAIRRQREKWEEAQRLGLRRVPQAKAQGNALDLSKPLSLGDLGL